MFSIVYSSTATAAFASIDLAELLNECRARNRKVGVTGMLMSDDGQFLQALEGPEHVVRDLMAIIELDLRHDHIRVLAEEQIPSRRFPDWAMGYGPIANIQASSLAHHSDALVAERRKLPASPSRLTSLAAWFRGR